MMDSANWKLTTIKELIDMLQQYPLDTPVFTPGYDEYGIASEFDLRRIVVKLGVQKAKDQWPPHESIWQEEYIPAYRKAKPTIDSEDLIEGVLLNWREY